MDSDIYSAAIFVLRTLIADGRIVRGSVIVFDELFNYCGFENHESLALCASAPVHRSHVSVAPIRDKLTLICRDIVHLLYLPLPVVVVRLSNLLCVSICRSVQV